MNSILVLNFLALKNIYLIRNNTVYPEISMTTEAGQIGEVQIKSKALFIERKLDRMVVNIRWNDHMGDFRKSSWCYVRSKWKYFIKRTIWSSSFY